MKRSRTMRYPIAVFKGIFTGFIIFTLMISAFMLLPPVKAEQAPLFSCTLTAPTTNPVRRQHAALIGSAMQSVGIDAKVVYVTWSDLIPRLFGDEPGKTFEEGGFDIGFIGWGFTAPVPDIKSQFLGTKEAFPPTGNNYALYNSSEANDLLKRIYTTSDTVLQQQLFRELSRVIFRDKPYIPIYYPTDVVARSKDIKIFGDPDVFSSMSTPFNDLQYMSGVDTYVFAEAGDWTSLAPWNNVDSNSFYALFVFGPTQGGLQLVDPRSNTLYMNEAESIKSSEDGLTWTVKIKPGIKFHDGVEATADDYLFTRWAILQPNVASVGLSDDLDRLGTKVYFTWLNGTTTVVDNTPAGEEPRIGRWKAVDRYTFTFTVPAPAYPFLNLTTTTMSPLPKHYLEQFPTSQWNSLTYATGLGGPYTFTWDTSKYGGSGSYTAYGPFGTGPYVYKGYDATKRLAKLEKFEDYWNKDALEAKGYFTVKDYYVAVIVEKDAAIAALRTGDVNALDVNYQLATDIDTLKGIGANVFLRPQIGWQEIGINMQHPILGTGVDTPLGRSDPSKAAEAARHVRQAISYLIPRDLIVQQLMAGAASPGITTLHAFGPAYGDPEIKADPYDPTLARAELAAAGYETGVSPVKPEPVPTKTAEYVLYGSGVPFEGSFVNPVTGQPAAGILGYVQESADKKTWKDLGAVVTDEDGSFKVLVTPTILGDVYLRTRFTGYTAPLPAFNPVGLVTGLDKLYYDQAVKNGTLPFVMAPQTSSPIKITTRTMADILTDAMKNTATKDDITSLSGEISDLQSAVNAITPVTPVTPVAPSGPGTTVTYASLAIAVISMIVAIYALTRKTS